MTSRRAIKMTVLLMLATALPVIAAEHSLRAAEPPDAGRAVSVPEGMEALVAVGSGGKTIFALVPEKSTRKSKNRVLKSLQSLAATESLDPLPDRPGCTTTYWNGTLKFYPYIGLICDKGTYTNCEGSQTVCPE